MLYRVGDLVQTYTINNPARAIMDWQIIPSRVDYITSIHFYGEMACYRVRDNTYFHRELDFAEVELL